jgi:hypothetical protein
MTRQSLPTRLLRDQPDLDQLKRQAKELLEDLRRGKTAAPGPDTLSRRARRHLRLHDAQLVGARSYGFDSWPKLRAADAQLLPGWQTPCAPATRRTSARC